MNAEMGEERKIIYEQVGIDVPTAHGMAAGAGAGGRGWAEKS